MTAPATILIADDDRADTDVFAAVRDDGPTGDITTTDAADAVPPRTDQL